jgi:glycerate kinase
VEQLETAHAHASRVLSKQTGREVGSEEGHGAAGGMPVLPSACFRTRMVPGGPFLAEELGLVEALREVDLVLTGEGRFDDQSIDGKVVGTVGVFAARCSPPPPVIVLAGDVGRAPELTAGLTACFALADGPATLSESQERAGALLAALAAEVVATVLAARNAPA